MMNVRQDKIENRPEENIEILFSIGDKVNGHSISPSYITLAILQEFLTQVNTFIRGTKYVDTKKITSSIEEGTLSIRTYGPENILGGALIDFEKINNSQDISDIDPKRRQVIELWQKLAKEHQDRTYKLSIGQSSEPILISSASNYHSDSNAWAQVELYVYGKVFDMGGKAKANVHVELENGNSLTVASDSNLLASDTHNRLYQKQLLRIRALQNILTGELKNEELLGYEVYNPKYDESVLAEIQERAAGAWNGKTATAWVNEMRGYSE